MRCCRRHNAGAAVTMAVALMPMQSRKARRRSTSARRAETKRSPRLQRFWATQRCRWIRRAESHDPGRSLASTKRRASDARCVSLPVPSTQSSELRSLSIPCSPTAAPGASFACRPAPSTASRFCPPVVPGPAAMQTTPASDTLRIGPGSTAMLPRSEPQPDAGTWRCCSVAARSRPRSHAPGHEEPRRVHRQGLACAATSRCWRC